MLLRYLVIGLYIGIATCLGGVLVRNFEIFHYENWAWEIENLASTMSLTVLVLIEMWNSLNALSENQSLLKVGIFSNLWLWGAIMISISTHLFILYVKPLTRIFGTVPLNFSQWILALVLSLPVIIIEEILKFVSR